MTNDNIHETNQNTPRTGESDLGTLNPEALFSHHASAVLSVCTKNTPHLQDAEALVQETFLRAFRKIECLRNPGRLRTWLLEITQEVCEDHRRPDVRCDSRKLHPCAREAWERRKRMR